MKLIGVTIFKGQDMNASEFTHHFYKESKERVLKVDDLNETYYVKIDYTEDDKIEVLSPDEVHPLDQFELTETINEAMKEIGIKVADKEITDEKTFEKSINEEAIKKFREIALSKLPKKESDPDEAEDANEEIQQSKG